MSTNTLLASLLASGKLEPGSDQAQLLQEAFEEAGLSHLNAEDIGLTKSSVSRKVKPTTFANSFVKAKFQEDVAPGLPENLSPELEALASHVHSHAIAVGVLDLIIRKLSPDTGLPFELVEDGTSNQLKTALEAEYTSEELTLDMLYEIHKQLTRPKRVRKPKTLPEQSNQPTQPTPPAQETTGSTESSPKGLTQTDAPLEPTESMPPVTSSDIVAANLDSFNPGLDSDFADEVDSGIFASAPIN